jgi:phenylpropionate dioxygenase-like ring-hydroxylating dioxygenase large terminal subunit
MNSDQSLWRHALDAEDLPVGTIRRVDEIDAVVWRGKSGRVCAMASRCPHQWAPLDIDGRVVGDTLVCIAHEWRFDQTGRGTKVNVNGREDRKGDIDVFECNETDGVVWVKSSANQ